MSISVRSIVESRLKHVEHDLTMVGEQISRTLIDLDNLRARKRELQAEKTELIVTLQTGRVSP